MLQVQVQNPVLRLDRRFRCAAFLSRSAHFRNHGHALNRGRLAPPTRCFRVVYHRHVVCPVNSAMGENHICPLSRSMVQGSGSPRSREGEAPSCPRPCSRLHQCPCPVRGDERGSLDGILRPSHPLRRCWKKIRLDQRPLATCEVSR